MTGQLDSNDLNIIGESLASWLLREYSFSQRMRMARATVRADKWNEMAELGWLGIGIPEAFGGIGGSETDALVTAHPFGQKLILEPYFSTVILSASLIKQFGSEDQKATLLPQVSRGELKLAFAYAEPECNFSLTDLRTVAARSNGIWTVTGHKAVVYDAPIADKILVLGRIEEDDSLGLFLVDHKVAYVSMSAYRTVDEKLAAEVEFKAAPATRIGSAGISPDDMERALELSITYLCREALGIAQAIYDETVAYLKTRKQFGKTLGEFQALQHRAVDMLLRLEAFKSLVEACNSQFSNAAERSRAISAAKAYLSYAPIWIGRQSIQLHGGMGVSDELVIGHYFRRLLAIEAAFGDSDYHALRFARFSDLEDLRT